MAAETMSGDERDSDVCRHDGPLPIEEFGTRHRISVRIGCCTCSPGPSDDRR
jgi:hypothetical protein